ncbi:unnamed protein product [Cunninghamella blakesleeana]
MLQYSTRYLHSLKLNHIPKTTFYKHNLKSNYCVLSTKRFYSHSRDNNNNILPDEYELRVGYAITVLQDELPLFFYNGLKSHDIYSQNIVLSDPHYTRLSIKGKTAYFGAAEMLRWSMGCYFDKADLEIIKMRVLPDKPKDDDTSNIMHFSSSSKSSSSSSSSSSYSTLSKSSNVLQSSFIFNNNSNSNSNNNNKSIYLSSTPLKNINEYELYNKSQQSRQLASIVQPSNKNIVNQLKHGNNSLLSSTSSNHNNNLSTTVRSLEIRWIMQARPRSFFSNKQQQQQQQLREVEGVFIYTFDHQGYICEHKIQRIQPSPSRRILLLHTYGSKLRSFLESLKRRTEPEPTPSGLGC